MAFFESFIIIPENNIKIKPEKINQKVPISNIIPKKDGEDGEDKIEESRNASTCPKPPHKIYDFGISTLPSENLAAAQNITETAKPITKSKLLEVSTGILVNGKKKTGSNTITIDKATKEIRSKIFDNICFKF